MTGAELRAWRERLGKDEAWALSIVRATRGQGLSNAPGECTVRERLELVESDCAYNGADKRVLRTAYRAALEAEEARQAAERGPVEPVCPEGVGTFQNGGYTWVRPEGHHSGGIGVLSDGSMCESGYVMDGVRRGAFIGVGLAITPACLRYAADLSEYRVAIHAASDKQRKLDAVKAAEAAHEKANAAYAATIRVLTAARREAGL